MYILYSIVYLILTVNVDITLLSSVVLYIGNARYSKYLRYNI